MERPAKKPRLQGPEGFQKPKSTYKPPESVRKFVSAFDSPKPEVPSTSPAKPPVRVSRTNHERPQNPFVRMDVSKEPEPQPEPGPSRAPVSKRQLKPVSFAHPPRAPKNDGKPVSLKVLKPPVFANPAAPPPVPVCKPPDKMTTSVLALQPVLKPPSTTSEKPRSILKPPPMPIASSSKHTAPLKPLAPPPPLPSRRPSSPQKNMKTILTTSIAQATDPTKEGAGAELLSLFLQQHGHNFTSSTERELQRGVMMSPDKRSRGKDPKFVRGGFAERAQHQISCVKTDFALWKRQIEQKVESRSKLPSDMHLRILKVLHIAKAPERFRSTPVARFGLALCRLTNRHKLVNDLTLGTYVVLLNFAPMQGSRSLVSSAEGFEEGRDVLGWMPWQKVDCVSVDGGEGLLELFARLDALNPPHSLLVISRFSILPPKPVNGT
ncbi:hypothetical protein HYDPIDRAFT_117154 [Hydnomerulius pinastri MD-312]|uniref:Uncharacterized protein n=1 Tax=Hydnomerulius pinastri MD-312 TaxID=994086 RepID=A0A0C9WAX7_9AGAM|nr:hypothetical protein HYDPIDRAFT_117154 [Hydnomerulius pinastri MD-312]